MTSRRKFIKAGLLSGLTAFPLASYSNAPAFDLQEHVQDDLYTRVRKQLLVPPNRIYLNTGTLGPSPLPIIEKVAAITRQLEANPGPENFGSLNSEIEQVREKVARFIHAERNEVVLTRNTTEGLNLIAQALHLNAGDEIITTNLEHGGLEVGLDFLKATRGVTVKKIELPLPATNPDEVVRVIEKSIGPSTRMLVLSHVNTITGLVMPFHALSKITQPKNIFLVADGAQAAGMMALDVAHMGVDAYATSGHKWLLGPKETGFLYLKKDFQEQVKPVFTFSGLTAYSASSGTRNVANLIGLGATLDWHEQLGVEKIQSQTQTLAAYCLNELKKIKTITILSPEELSLASGIVSFSPQTIKNNQVAEKLAADEIIVKVLPQLNGIRISCHCFVSKKDLDQFITALKKALPA